MISQLLEEGLLYKYHGEIIDILDNIISNIENNVSDDKCPICYRFIGKLSNLSITSCNHKFCSCCIVSLIKCPLCRNDLKNNKCDTINLYLHSNQFTIFKNRFINKDEINNNEVNNNESNNNKVNNNEANNNEANNNEINNNEANNNEINNNEINNNEANNNEANNNEINNNEINNNEINNNEANSENEINNNEANSENEINNNEANSENEINSNEYEDEDNLIDHTEIMGYESSMRTQVIEREDSFPFYEQFMNNLFSTIEVITMSHSLSDYIFQLLFYSIIIVGSIILFIPVIIIAFFVFIYTFFSYLLKERQ